MLMAFACTYRKGVSPLNVGSIVRVKGQLAEVTAVLSPHQLRIKLGDEERKIATHLVELVHDPSDVPEEPVQVEDGDPVFSSEEATEYLEYGSVVGLRAAIDRGRLQPDGLIGRAYYFRKSTLDRFKHKHRNEEALTIKEAAELFGIKERRLQTWIYETGKLRNVGSRGRAHVYSRADIQSLVDADATAVA